MWLHQRHHCSVTWTFTLAQNLRRLAENTPGSRLSRDRSAFTTEQLLLPAEHLSRRAGSVPTNKAVKWAAYVLPPVAALTRPWTRPPRGDGGRLRQMSTAVNIFLSERWVFVSDGWTKTMKCNMKIFLVHFQTFVSFSSFLPPSILTFLVSYLLLCSALPPSHLHPFLPTTIFLDPSVEAVNCGRCFLWFMFVLDIETNWNSVLEPEAATGGWAGGTTSCVGVGCKVGDEQNK